LAVVKTLNASYEVLQMFASENSPASGRKFLAEFLQVTDLAVWKVSLLSIFETPASIRSSPPLSSNSWLRSKQESKQHSQKQNGQ